MKNKIYKIIREKNFLSLSTSLIAASLGLISFMILTRSLEKAFFGNWVLYVTIATFFDMLRFGLTSNALVRFASGGNIEKNRSYMGASYKIGLWLVGAMTLFCWTGLVIVNAFEFNINNGYLLFLQWYPILALLNLSWNNSVSLFQAEQRFKLILYIRLLNIGSFVVFLLVNYLWLHWGLFEIVIANLISNLLPSLLVFIKRWDGFAQLKEATKETTREILNFGRYSMGTLIGSSLLRSADTIIIGLSPILGSVGIAQYAIPLKLTDLLGIPLRSFSITAYPKMSKKSHDGDIEGLKKIFYGYSSVVTLLFIPVAILCFILAEPLVLFLGGSEYKESLPMIAMVFRIFAIYSILLPIDRFTGVALDSINKPRFNFNKVMIMAGANIVGDFIAVFVFQSIEAVAIVTVLFTLIGIVLGYYYLSREMTLSLRGLVSEGLVFFRNLRNHI
ncbi:oligosaccharide flippase family protein [Roseimarinus sediminis]|jgi:O-antigen/teichoic acid export membrane protein|uniref:oligosaccharide flippase family protein n=1 Tax=Roseimarinus sediminis TaxID=1610899 RepID=UPI003D2003CF